MPPPPTRYAVGSGLWSNTTTVWSDTDGGPAGSFVPVDGDEVVITTAVNVQVDVDQSAWTGMHNVIILGGVTPGSIYWKDGTSGTLKISTGYTLSGTNDTNKGRLIANSDGVWATATGLAYADKAVILLEGTSYVEASSLDVNELASEPTLTRIRLYGTKKTVSSVDTANDTLTIVAHGYTAGKKLAITSNGDVPIGLYEDRIYYVRTVTADTFKLAVYNADIAIVDLAGSGTGTIEVYDEPATLATTVNTLDDVTADNWTAGDACVLVNDGAPEFYDQQRLTVDTITATTVTLSAAIDSAQYPCCHLYLVQRNVAIRSSGQSYSQGIIQSGTGGIFAEIRNTAGSTVTFYGYGIYYGTSHTATIISGCYHGIYYGTSHTVTTINGCYYGVSFGTIHTVTTVSGCYISIYNGTSHTVTTISGCSYGIYYGTTHTVTTISGCYNGNYYGTAHAVITIDRCHYGNNHGTSSTATAISGCIYGIYYGTSHAVITISGCYYGIAFGELIVGRGTLFENNLTADVYSSLLTGHGIELASVVQVNNSVPYSSGKPWAVTIYDVALSGTIQNGSLAVWSRGGELVSHSYVEGVDGDLQASGWALPDPDWIHTATMSTTALATGETVCPLEIDIPLQAVDGETINLEVNIKLSTTTDWDTLPRAQIIDLSLPYGDVSEVISESATTASSGWQNLTLSYAATSEKQLALRITGTRTTRDESYDWCWRQTLPAGGGGSAFISGRRNSMIGR